MKRYSGLILFLLSISLLSGYFMSHVPLIGRLAMNFKSYRGYAFLKTWWKGALFVFVVLAVLLLVQHILNKWFANRTAKIIHIVCLLLALYGLYYTYNDFQDDFSHHIMREKFHIGGYLLWIGWVGISLFFLFTKKTEISKNAGAI